MAALDLIPIPYLRECLSYDPESGSLRWRERPRSHFLDDRAHRIWNTRFANTEAGEINHGKRYLQLKLNGERRRIFAHRAAWALMKGEYPPNEIIHDDTNRLNNRFSNLRACVYISG